MKRKTIITILLVAAAVLVTGVATFLTVQGVRASGHRANSHNKERTPVTSAVEFFAGSKTVISEDDIEEKAGFSTGGTVKIDGEDYYFGYTPNMFFGKRFAMKKLSEQESVEILTARDITEITAFQAECLTRMLTVDKENKSAIDLTWTNTGIVSLRTAYYYYLEDATVIVVNDFRKMIKETDKAWILVIPNGEEAGYPFEIPAPGVNAMYPEDDPDGVYAACQKDLLNYLEGKTA